MGGAVVTLGLLLVALSRAVQGLHEDLVSDEALVSSPQKAHLKPGLPRVRPPGAAFSPPLAASPPPRQGEPFSMIISLVWHDCWVL